jgi:hypothetical protein
MGSDRSKDHAKVNIQKYGYDINWTHLVEDGVRFENVSVNMVMNIRVT